MQADYHCGDSVNEGVKFGPQIYRISKGMLTDQCVVLLQLLFILAENDCQQNRHLFLQVIS